MDLPASLLRMLEVSCSNDSLKNWSVYQERDGSYTFKIRFSTNTSRHIDDNSTPLQDSCSSGVKSAFKRKTRSQIDRDSARSKVFQERSRPSTRSQTAKQRSDDTAVKTPHESPIETVRHCSLNSESPSLFPISIDLNTTERELPEIPDSDMYDSVASEHNSDVSTTDSSDTDCGCCQEKYQMRSSRRSKCTYIACRPNAGDFILIVKFHIMTVSNVKTVVNLFMSVTIATIVLLILVTRSI